MVRLLRFPALLLGAVSIFACSDHDSELGRLRSDGPSEPAAPVASAAPAAPVAQPTPAAPVAPPRQFAQPTVIDLGELSPGDAVMLNLPPNAVSFNVVVEFPGAQWVGIQKITSPSGQVVLDEFTPQGGSHRTTWVSGRTQLLAAATVPVNEALAGKPLEPGGWTLAFAGESQTSSRMRATMRVQTTGDGQLHGGELDLNVYVPEGLMIANPSQPHAVTAASAGQDPDVVARVDKFYALVKQLLGVDRGKVAFYPIPATHTSITSNEALDAAAAATTGRPDEQAFNLMLTNKLELDGMAVWGIAPGLPGAAGRTGTTLSNVALRVTTEIQANAVDGDATTILHEGGHFFGLEHPTEFDGSVDGLSDTPSCPALSSTAPNTACPDLSNVMFAAGDFSPNPTLSPSQTAILRASPVIRALLLPTAAPRAFGGPADNGARLATAPLTSLLTRSGRALRPTERWIAGGFCGSVKLDVGKLVELRGRATVMAELTEISGDDDVPAIMRDNAIRLLERLQ